MNIKDPAFLFYSSDFLSGTFTMNNEQIGKYIRLLCIQHQKGILSEKDMLNICGSYDEDIYSKFKKSEHGYYNERLNFEAERRKNYTESRRNNRKKSELDKKTDKNEDKKNICSSYELHMETVTENETVIENINEIEKGGEGGKTEIELQVDEVLNHFVEVTGKKIDATKEVHRKFVKGRIKEKIPIEDLKKIIELKNFKWKDDAKMREYIRPETLFNPTKCNSYLMEVKDIENNPELLKKIVEHVKFGKTGKQHSAMEAYKQQLYQNV